MTTAAPFLQRHFGDYLLVAQLSEDPLGTVFRALYAVDERRFVRLRILRSEDLLPEPVDAAVARHSGSLGRVVHDALVARPHLDSVDDLPFMTWDETGGWTLDTMLARVRAFGIRIPAEYALLIAERIAAALEHAQHAGGSGVESRHGLLWPGFVSISHDAAVRVGGFGIADGIRPSLSRGRIAAEVAPYVAPEARVAPAVPSADVYSLGALLVELLTARRPAPEGPSADLRAADPRSEELGRFLQRCLAPEGERFATPSDAHRALQQIVTGNPFSLYTANLSLFLYKLLNPESQSVATSDFDSTNPVAASRRGDKDEKTAPAAESAEPGAVRAGRTPTPFRRADDFADFADVDRAIDALEPTAVEHDAKPVVLVFPASDGVGSNAEGAFAAAESRIEKMSLWKEPAAEVVPEPAAPVEVVARATRLLEQDSRRLRAPVGAEWRRPAAALAAAAGLTVVVFLAASRISLPAPAPSDAPRAEAANRASDVAGSLPVAAAAEAPAPTAAAAIAPAALTSARAASAASFGDVISGPSQLVRAAAMRRGLVPRPELRRPTEELRLRAALARIEADRVNARESAGDLFGEGRNSEEEGERLLRAQEYESAQLAFSRAARLFQKAQELSWEERVRKTSLAGGSESVISK